MGVRCGESRIILATCHTLNNAKKGRLQSLILVFANEMMRAREQEMFKVAADTMIECKVKFCLPSEVNFKSLGANSCVIIDEFDNVVLN